LAASLAARAATCDFTDTALGAGAFLVALRATRLAGAFFLAFAMFHILNGEKVNS
jgi:hypothetical protein